MHRHCDGRSCSLHWKRALSGSPVSSNIRSASSVFHLRFFYHFILPLLPVSLCNFSCIDFIYLFLYISASLCILRLLLLCATFWISLGSISSSGGSFLYWFTMEMFSIFPLLRFVLLLNVILLFSFFHSIVEYSYLSCGSWTVVRSISFSFVHCFLAPSQSSSFYSIWHGFAVSPYYFRILRALFCFLLASSSLTFPFLVPFHFPSLTHDFSSLRLFSLYSVLFSPHPITLHILPPLLFYIPLFFLTCIFLPLCIPHILSLSSDIRLPIAFPVSVSPYWESAGYI